MDAQEIKSSIKREHDLIKPLVRVALLTVFVILGALLSPYVENKSNSAAHIVFLLFAGFVVIVVSLSLVGELTGTIFRRSDNLIGSGNGVAPSVSVVPLGYHSRCSEPGCRKLGRIILRYTDGRPQNYREFCHMHGDAKVKRDRAAGLRVNDDLEGK